jgi:hypothetical protein
MRPSPDRARDLIAAAEILSRHRNADPTTYRQVHVAATGALDALHAALLDPREGDLDEGLATYGDLVRQLRALPRPTTGQPIPPSGRPAPDPLTTFLGRRFGPAAGIESVLSDVASGISPNLERAVRDGLRDLLSGSWLPTDREESADDEDRDDEDRDDGGRDEVGRDDRPDEEPESA